jgi:hypothetical protein
VKRLLIGAAIALTVAGAAVEVQAQPRHHGRGGWNHGGGGWNHGGWDRGRQYRGDYRGGYRYRDYRYRAPRYSYGYGYAYPYAFYLNIGPTYRRSYSRRHWECWYTRHGREVCGWVRHRHHRW